ncbi:peroxiredoxin [Thermococci archaeon]|nr:MAG: peroxiredoxin [Thermococci archaeon]
MQLEKVIVEEVVGGRIPLLGEEFPEIEVNTTQGIIKLPDHYKGKWFILFSHPADFTPVCTTEFVAFQRKYEEFKRMNAELIGLSIDQTFSHIKWIEWIEDKLGVKIEFPVIADDLGNVSLKLGLIHPGKGTNTVRAVFIVDPKGIIRLILYYPQEIGRNIDEIVRALKALQISDRNKVALPANWPDNELIVDKAILPPAMDIETAKERMKMAERGEVECYDWWFCYKRI